MHWKIIGFLIWIKGKTEHKFPPLFTTFFLRGSGRIVSETQDRPRFLWEIKKKRKKTCDFEMMVDLCRKRMGAGASFYHRTILCLHNGNEGIQRKFEWWIEKFHPNHESKMQIPAPRGEAPRGWNYILLEWWGWNFSL